jgi:putative sigma-54 modulation protein
MQVFLESSDVVLPRNEGEALATRFRSAFERFANRIESLSVSLKDVNGPRGGRDKVCMIRVELAKGRQIIVRERSFRLRRAIGKSIRRTKVLVAHELKRRSRNFTRPLTLNTVEAM